MDIRKSWVVKTPIAHRGFHNAELPENSLGAFENAVKHNYAIELDVRLTDDEEVVVFHDDTLSRMTSSDGYVCNLQSEKLKSLCLEKTDFTIPTLSETLELVNERAPILIEIKNTEKVGKLEAQVAKILSSYKGEIAVQSFNPFSLEYFKTKVPGLLRGQLSAKFSKKEVPSFFKRFLLSRLKLNHISKPDFVSFNGADLPNYHVSKTKLPVLAWTVRSDSELESVLPYCDNIIFEKIVPELTEK